MSVKAPWLSMVIRLHFPLQNYITWEENALLTAPQTSVQHYSTNYIPRELIRKVKACTWTVEQFLKTDWNKKIITRNSYKQVRSTWKNLTIQKAMEVRLKKYHHLVEPIKRGLSVGCRLEFLENVWCQLGKYLVECQGRADNSECWCLRVSVSTDTDFGSNVSVGLKNLVSVGNTHFMGPI